MSQEQRGKPIAGLLPADPVARLCLVMVVLLTVIYAVVGAAIGPSTYSDSAFGFRIWDSMREGAAFNHLTFPRPADIARDISTFETTWTPGQYFFPGWLEAFGLNLGLSIMVVVTACAALGLWGWYALYRALGFSLRTAAITVAIIAGSRHFSLPFGIYNGGEILQFAGAPWGFLLVWRLRDLRWSAVPSLIAATAGLVFLKLSGIVFSGAAISAAVLAGGPPWISRETVRKGIVAGATLVLAAALFQYAWLSRGWTAMSGAGQLDFSKFVPMTVFTLANTWTGIFSFGSLADYLFFFPDHEILSSRTPVDYILLPPALATFAFMAWRLRREHAVYLRFTLLAAAAMTVFFVMTWVAGSLVSPDERHFRPISLLLMVGVVEAFLGVRSLVLRGVFAAVAGVTVLYGLGSYVQHARTNLHDPMGQRGFRLHIATPPALDYLRTVDKADPDGTRPLIYVPTPEIGLELRHARIITEHANFESAEFLSRFTYKGRVRRLYVLLQTPLVANGKADVILRSFVDYARESWKMTPLGDFVVFSNTP